jgi:hexokinase
MSDVMGFLKKHGLCAGGFDAEVVLDAFRSEMEKGLAGDESSLKMIPTFMTAHEDLPIDEPVIVIDAGGTNLRIAVIRFGAGGEIITDELTKYQMPGVEKELSANEFFGAFAKYLEPVADKSNKIGFCFSYPAEILSDRDGKLIHWTKDIKVPEVEGQCIGKGLLKAMGAAGEGKSIAVLNDTVATLLAGKAASCGKDYSSYVGFILGTGTNMAYIEQNDNITKRDDLDTGGSQAINVESGNFALAPRGGIDEKLDVGTMDPGIQKFEKMISGLYRGEHILMVLNEAVAEGLIDGACAEYIAGLDELSGMDVDMFLEGSGKGPLADGVINDVDAEILKDIINGIYLRIAKLTAVNISAAVLKSGAGTDPARPVCVNIDGSTYYKSVGFKDMVETYLEQILGGRGIAYELMRVDEAPLIGAAVGGLS